MGSKALNSESESKSSGKVEERGVKGAFEPEPVVDEGRGDWILRFMLFER